MTPVILSIIGVAVLATLIYALQRLERVVLRSIAPSAPVADPQITPAMLVEISKEVDRNREAIGRLTLAVEHGIERVDPAEKRVQKTVTSARRLLRENGLEHAGLDAEASELRERDGEASEEPELQLVPAQVAPRRHTGIPGLSLETLDEMMS